MESKDLLLVIDMQNVYREGEAWGCAHTERALENIKKLLDSGIDAVFTRFDSPQNPEGVWKEYCRVNREIDADPYLGAMMDELTPYLSSHPLYSKSVYSSFSIPEVREKASRCGRLLITGVVAECCVLSTLISAVDAGVPFIYIKDGVSGLTDKSEAETAAIVSYFTPLHGCLMETDEYLSPASGSGDTFCVK